MYEVLPQIFADDAEQNRKNYMVYPNSALRVLSVLFLLCVLRNFAWKRTFSRKAAKLAKKTANKN